MRGHLSELQQQCHHDVRRLSTHGHAHLQVLEEGDCSLYTVTILKGQYQAGFYDGEQFQAGMFVDYVEAFKKAAKEKRFTVRCVLA